MQMQCNGSCWLNDWLVCVEGSAEAGGDAVGGEQRGDGRARAQEPLGGAGPARGLAQPDGHGQQEPPDAADHADGEAGGGGGDHDPAEHDLDLMPRAPARRQRRVLLLQLLPGVLPGLQRALGQRRRQDLTWHTEKTRPTASRL